MTIKCDRRGGKRKKKVMVEGGREAELYNRCGGRWKKGEMQKREKGKERREGGGIKEGLASEC